LTLCANPAIGAPSQLALHPGEVAALLLKYGNQAIPGLSVRFRVN